MSRVAKTPILIPSGVKITLNNSLIVVNGKLGELNVELNELVVVTNTDSLLVFTIAKVNKKREKLAWAQAGTARTNIANSIKGVSKGWEKKLLLIGVGYRASINQRKLDLTLGFSYVKSYQVPDGIEVTTPIQTEIVVKGIDKQKVGQVAADIRSCRPPEPYKGKGIRGADEQVFRKESKKK